MSDKQPVTAQPDNRYQRTHDDKLTPPVASRPSQQEAHDAKPPATALPLYFSHDKPATEKDTTAATLHYETGPVSKPDGVTAHPQSHIATAR